MNKDKMGIYVHIPFCKRKCDYCDFVSQTADKALTGRYVNALVSELFSLEEKYGFSKKEYDIATVYIGGGTPSVLEGSDILRIVGVIRDTYSVLPDAEITIEINPGTVTEDKLRCYRDAGINRISIGLQSANDDELKLLSRIHDFKSFLNCYELVGKAGFDNVNVDIMTALPGQSEERLLNTLNTVIGLSPGHISAYSLMIEENTPFYDRYAEGAPHEHELPGEDEERKLYYLTRDTLGEAGYEQYEISNFALKDKYSRHNVSYWKRIPYLGAGLNASGLVNEIRYRNTSDINRYMEAPASPDIFEEKIVLSENDRMDETMFLGLPMNEGVSATDFLRTFGISMYEKYGNVIEKLAYDGLIQGDEKGIRLTDRGRDYGNYVFSRFLS
ncbi:MAG: radical SAM family heme chaperone HemW [Lachnospiraceae bacterium]|nr:radical SAM family heme chaperone HemW [Lachnospiraceae bacterium]